MTGMRGGRYLVPSRHEEVERARANCQRSFPLHGPIHSTGGQHAAVHSINETAEARPIRLIREDVVSLYATVHAEAGGRPLH